MDFVVLALAMVADSEYQALVAASKNLVTSLDLSHPDIHLLQVRTNEVIFVRCVEWPVRIEAKIFKKISKNEEITGIVDIPPGIHHNQTD